MKIKKIISALLVLLILFSLFGCEKEKFVAYEDENGHIILSEDDPHFYYLEKYDDSVSRDIELMKKAEESMYIPDDNKDFYVSDYKDGICINSYMGDDEDVVIPEYIGGKKVIKIGCDIWYHEIDTGPMTVPPFYDEYRDFEIDTIFIPSGVKEISFASLDWGKRIVVDKDNPYYFSIGGILFSRETKKVLLIPYHLFFYRSVEIGNFSLDEVQEYLQEEEPIEYLS